MDGRRRMRLALAGRSQPGDVWVLAVGKAAAAMTLGALDALGPRLTRALVISRTGHFEAELAADDRVTCIEGGHPVPDEGSLVAGAAALAMAREAAPGQPVLLLVSGGASSLLEVLPQGIALADLRRIGEWALASGLPIEGINTVRRRLSVIKDGGLPGFFGHCSVEGFFISDVPGDDAALVGSGLLKRAVGAARDGDLPGWVKVIMARSPTTAPVERHIPITCVGRLDEALEAIREAALVGGIRAVVSPERLEGDAVAVASRVCEGLGHGAVELVIHGGETTVRLPSATGRGGRNQHLALAAAGLIAGREDVLVLAIGTDGTDGNSDDAGGLVDGGTIERGRDAGLDPDQCLARADSGRFLEASGDLVHTGPTGTNVGDLVLTLQLDPNHSLQPGPSM